MSTLSNNIPRVPTPAGKRDRRKGQRSERKYTLTLPTDAVQEITAMAAKADEPSWGRGYLFEDAMKMAIVNWLCLTPTQRRTVAVDVYEPWSRNRDRRRRRFGGTSQAAEISRPINETPAEPEAESWEPRWGLCGTVHPMHQLVALLSDVGFADEREQICHALIAYVKSDPTARKNIARIHRERGLAPKPTPTADMTPGKLAGLDGIADWFGTLSAAHRRVVLGVLQAADLAEGGQDDGPALRLVGTNQEQQAPG